MTRTSCEALSIFLLAPLEGITLPLQNTFSQDFLSVLAVRPMGWVGGAKELQASHALQQVNHLLGFTSMLYTFSPYVGMLMNLPLTNCADISTSLCAIVSSWWSWYITTGSIREDERDQRATTLVWRALQWHLCLALPQRGRQPMVLLSTYK